MKQHWTLIYLVNRIKAGFYWRFNQDKPWLTKKANRFLDNTLNEQMIGLEFGSGRSTLFFAKKLMKLVSVEHNQEWFSKVKNLLKEHGTSNVDYKHISVDINHPNESGYHKVLDDYQDDYFDFILVDGENRGLCAMGALNKLKTNGLLVIDNVNWYLPSSSIAPTSISRNASPADETWNKVHNQITHWKTIWTSNGVTDTAIFVKP